MRLRRYAKAYAALIGTSATAVLGTGVLGEGPVTDTLTVVAALGTVFSVWAVSNDETPPEDVQ